MKKVLVVGGASFDSIIYLEEFPKPEPKTFHKSEFQETVGSTGVGKTTNLSKLDFNVTFHALIGKDVYAEKIREYLKMPNITFLYYEDGNGTQRHVNIMNKQGERISIFVNNSSDKPNLDFAQFDPLIRHSDFVVLNITNYSRFLIPICQQLNKPIWTDLHDYNLGNSYHQDFIKAANYIFLSSDNLSDYRPFMEKMIEEGKELVVCTHGKNGASGTNKAGQWLEVEAVKDFDLVDSNGAGDAFFSGFLYAHARGYDFQKCLEMGSINGALCIHSRKLYAENLNTNRLEDCYRQYFS